MSRLSRNVPARTENRRVGTHPAAGSGAQAFASQAAWLWLDRLLARPRRVDRDYRRRRSGPAALDNARRVAFCWNFDNDLGPGPSAAGAVRFNAAADVGA
jgi:hypothetical protein